MVDLILEGQNNIQNEIYSIEETKSLIKSTFLKNGKYMVPRSTSARFKTSLVKSIYEHTKQYKNITLLMRCKFLCNEIDKSKIECICGKEVMLFGYTLGKCCDSKECLKMHLSSEAKKRGTWMMLTPEAKEKKRISLTGRKLSEENKRKIGESNAKKWTDEYKKRDREHRIKMGSNEKISRSLKAKILNGEYSPKSENRKRSKRLKSLITGISYRSNWELIFHEKNLHLEYESVRMIYIENNVERIYITDFTDRENKIIYEIKPTSELLNSNFLLKKKFAEEWCALNGYEFKIITEKDYIFYGRK